MIDRTKKILRRLDLNGAALKDPGSFSAALTMNQTTLEKVESLLTLIATETVNIDKVL